MPKTPLEDEQKKEEQAFQQLDAAKIKEEITSELDPKLEKKAEEIAEKKVQERLGALGKQISGEETAKYSWEKEGRDKPKDWDEVVAEVENRVEGKVEQRFKQSEEKKKKEMEKVQEKQRAVASEMSSQWQELVSKKALPEINDEIASKLKAGQKVPTSVAESDPGLQAWRKISSIATSEGKTFKEAYYEDYLTETAGQNAPVFGGKRSVDATDSEADYSYEEIRKARKRG